MSVGKKDTLIISKLKLNTKDSEYSPFIINNNFYFVSNRPSEVGVLDYDKNNEFLSKIYEAKKIDSMKFSNLAISNKLNSTLNSGPLSFYKNQVYFTSTGVKKNLKSKLESPLRIYSANLDSNNIFQNITEVNLNLSDSINVCHPAIYKDSILYFTYYKKGGTTGTDLYYSINSNGTWSYPLICRGPINSISNEAFPYVYDDKLYFSSAREGGAGKLDVYYINFYDSLKVLNTVKDLNSAEDDFGVYFISDNSGYFSSNRSSNDDIYYFTYAHKPKFEICKEQIVNNYCYILKEKASYDAMDTVNMYYEWSFGDGQKAKGLIVNHCFPGEGLYTVELNVVEKNSGETFTNELSYDLEVKNEQQVYITSFDTVATNSSIEFNSSHSKIDNYTISKYYWDFGTEAYFDTKDVFYKFNKAGTYIVKLLTDGKFKNQTTQFGVFKKIIVIDDYVVPKDKIKEIPKYYNK